MAAASRCQTRNYHAQV